MKTKAVSDTTARNLGDVAVSLSAWRREHPRATLAEIERALDERLSKVRAELLTDLAMASEAAAIAGKPGSERPTCPECQQALVSRGQMSRTLLTTHDREVRLKRAYGRCPACGLELFPPR
jgi:predicted RNA-binding Zn-ribbon protein involved in translation (DUF1610 family)